MIITTVEVDNNRNARIFTSNTLSRMANPKGPAQALNLSSGFKAVTLNDKILLCYGYRIIGEEITNILSSLLAIVIVALAGFTPWLLFPLMIWNMPLVVRFLGYYLLKKGLRKAGYKGKVKLVPVNDFIARGVL